MMNADMVAQAVEKFAQILPLDIAEIFIWYFEQKGVENPERFLDQEKLQFMKQNEKLQMLTQNNNIVGQLSQMAAPKPEQKELSAEMPQQNSQDEMENEVEEIPTSGSMLTKLFDIAKQHVLSKDKEN